MMHPVPMPARHSTAEAVAIATARCVKLACAKHYGSRDIGSVAEVVSGGTPSTNISDYWDGEVVWVTPKDLGKRRNIEVDSSERLISPRGLQASSARLLPVGSVLLSSRAPIGHLGISTVPLATNQGFKNIICSSLITPRFLFHMLRASIDDLQQAGRGNTFSEIPASIVKTYPVPLPPLVDQQKIVTFLDTVYLRLAGEARALPVLPKPLSGQRRIVAKIEQLAAKIDEARGLQARSRAEACLLPASSSKELFSCIQSWGTVEEIVGRINLKNGKSIKSTPLESPIHCLRLSAIRGGRIDCSDSKPVPLPMPEARPYLIRPKDVFIMRGNGSRELVGLAAMAEDVPDGTVFPDLLIKVPLAQTGISPEFFVSFWNCPIHREVIEDSAKTTSGIWKINQGHIASFRIPRPSLAEQRRIVEYLDGIQAKVDGLKALQSESAAELDALLPSILDKAFRGEL